MLRFSSDCHQKENACGKNSLIRNLEKHQCRTGCVEEILASEHHFPQQTSFEEGLEFRGKLCPSIKGSVEGNPNKGHHQMTWCGLGFLI